MTNLNRRPSVPPSPAAAAPAVTEAMQAQTRYRCKACGNITRFDVKETITQTSLYHYTLGGELDREELHVVSRTVEDISCRWCGHGKEVVEEGEIEEGPDVA
jgi:rubredoxin